MRVDLAHGVFVFQGVVMTKGLVTLLPPAGWLLKLLDFDHIHISNCLPLVLFLIKSGEDSRRFFRYCRIVVLLEIQTLEEVPAVSLTTGT